MNLRPAVAFAALLLTTPLHAAPPAHRTSDEVLVVYNDDGPVSKSIALDYAQQRHVDNVLPIHTVDSSLRTGNETIPMAAYASAVETPVRDFLTGHPKVQFIVLTKGVPLRIRGADTGQRGDRTKPETPLTASVDNHIASMDYAKLPGVVRMSITGSGATGDGTPEPADLKGTVILTESAWGTFNADMKLAHDLLDGRHIPNELDLSPTFVGDPLCTPTEPGRAGPTGGGTPSSEFP